MRQGGTYRQLGLAHGHGGSWEEPLVVEKSVGLSVQRSRRGSKTTAVGRERAQMGRERWRVWTASESVKGEKEAPDILVKVREIMALGWGRR